jgi:tRNA(Ile)-lysidine synthase
MNLTDRFKEHIRKEALFTKGNRLLLAVSGGVDSVVLCELCFTSGLPFSIAHCNFKLRAQESERDESFVRDLARKYGVECFVKTFDTNSYAQSNKFSIQVAARELRYEWFHQLIENSTGSGKANAVLDYIVTAHHADDNQETMLMNFFKGTGISGLRGMLPRQGKLIRPLLPFFKEELLEFANLNKLSYVEDSSNASEKYTRNYFRNQVIPFVEKVYPSVKTNLSDNLRRFADIELLYQEAIARHKKKLIEAKGNELHIPVLKLKKIKPLETVVFEIIKDFGFSSGQLGEVIGLLESESGKFTSSADYRVIRNRAWLIIAPLETAASNLFTIQKDTKRIDFTQGTLEFKIVDEVHHQLSSDTRIASIDTKGLKYPLLLRKWKQGDYFYPLGMKKKKKLSRFFIDIKLSKTEKENTWVLEMDKKIVWIVGRRLDDRFKIGPFTKTILQVKLLPND